MFIDKVTLTNIRGFKKLEFSFDRGNSQYAGWTVFTGDNGAGKSTLLKAIAVALTGTDTARALQPSFHRWISNNEHEGTVELEVVRHEPDDSLTKGGKPPNKKFPVCIVLSEIGKDTTLSHRKPNGKSDSRSYTTPDRTIWSPEANGWFSCGYGPFRRVFGASPEATRQMVATATERFVTMFQEAASLAEVDQWLRKLNHKKLEGKPQETQQLEQLLVILGDDLLPNQITIEGVDSDGLWLKDRQGVKLAWSEMSDGYRAALALLADILRHLINTYGIDDLTARDANGKLFVQRSGVVLIDEIDAHLHPEWQREIGFWLKSHFPNIQFLVTSHSPLICQAADPNGLFVLPEPGSGQEARALTQEEYQKIIASRPDTILQSAAFGLQNTRSPQAVEARAGYAKLKSKQRAGATLSAQEKEQLGQMNLFINPDEEP